jgi:hypothetical protein
MRSAASFAPLAVTVLAALALAGCPGGDPPTVGPAPPNPTDGGDGHDHEYGHAEHGPHGGHIIELGDERYHAELAHDDAAGTVTVYILDGKAENPSAIDAVEVTINLVIDGQPQQFTLPAAPQEGDAEGRSSRFELADADLLEALEGDATCRLNVEIDGTPLLGDIDHHAHDHEEGHDHEGEEDHDQEDDHDHDAE